MMPDIYCNYTCGFCKTEGLIYMYAYKFTLELGLSVIQSTYVSWQSMLTV